MQRPPEYSPLNIGICKARVLLGARGVADPEAQLRAALQDGTIIAWGLVDGVWREIHSVWWRHLNSPLEDTVWFDRKDTEPPTPFRAETVEVPFAQLNLLWLGPGSSDGHTSKVGEAAEATQPRVGSSSANQPSEIFPPPQSAGRRRGPKPDVMKRIIAEMEENLQEKETTLTTLDEDTEETLASQYKASRDTVRKARKKVLEDHNFVGIRNSDK